MPTPPTGTNAAANAAANAAPDLSTDTPPDAAPSTCPDAPLRAGIRLVTLAMPSPRCIPCGAGSWSPGAVTRSTQQYASRKHVPLPPCDPGRWGGAAGSNAQCAGACAAGRCSPYLWAVPMPLPPAVAPLPAPRDLATGAVRPVDSASRVAIAPQHALAHALWADTRPQARARARAPAPAPAPACTACPAGAVAPRALRAVRNVPRGNTRRQRRRRAPNGAQRCRRCRPLRQRQRPAAAVFGVRAGAPSPFTAAATCSGCIAGASPAARRRCALCPKGRFGTEGALRACVGCAAGRFAAREGSDIVSHARRERYGPGATGMNATDTARLRVAGAVSADCAARAARGGTAQPRSRRMRRCLHGRSLGGPGWRSRPRSALRAHEAGAARRV